MRAKSSLSPGSRITAANTRGEMIPAILLHIPIMLILLAALSIGPMMVT